MQIKAVITEKNWTIVIYTPLGPNMYMIAKELSQNNHMKMMWTGLVFNKANKLWYFVCQIPAIPDKIMSVQHTS